ncbi:FAD-dependent oxidoreductase [Leptolyngbya iicbica]|uniref:NAD(P)/FAD-dependent oxidoreductase n=2 Tax=Cyanophyceae TaxID=3028117 RepID=A0A4Q7E8T0_9CYAN|nr:NAD(P)/FAD-dependent oxidoreductase [Leptolyngbya sp. LK]RZM77251.1 NAD(P)/FAD-dependent oxidoreductase [Leptolyngbya sp. LK]
MAVEYDLVIVGGTSEGITAATAASRYGARVALILQGLDSGRSHLIQQGLWSLTATHPLAMPPGESGVSPWQWAKQRATLIADTLTRDTAVRLMVQGVDVIAETGQIVGDRPLTLVTATRRLTTRKLLIATGSHAIAPPLPGLATVPYDTPATLCQREHLPSSVVILGGSPMGIGLAQWLARWSVKVTLLTASTQFFTTEDPDVAGWLTAQLRADGVDMCLGARIISVSQPPDPPSGTAIAVQLESARITADSLVVATRPGPYLHDLGLQHCLPRDRPLTVNAHLQTEHPRIYACGAAIGGDELPAIARQEAECAVHNALLWPRRRVNYQTLPYELPTQPPTARVGFTELQAVQRFGASAVLVARQSLYENPTAQWREATSGFCKLIAHRDGRLLGCHSVGPEASVWVQAVALLMAAKTPWWHLANSPTLPDSLMEIVRQAAQQWESDRWQPGQWRRDWAENWCNWRRNT